MHGYRQVDSSVNGKHVHPSPPPFPGIFQVLMRRGICQKASAQGWGICQFFWKWLKGHMQSAHVRMCISYHFLAGLADMHVTRQAHETDGEKRIWNI